jgi:anti-sigma factor RsiW
MTPVPGPHLTPDDLDAWIAGTLAPAAQDHLAFCPACQERTETEREIVTLLGALPLIGPAPGFADRVMARVSVPEPSAARSPRSLRSRVFATRRTTALAASLLVLVAGSMAGSVV